MVIPAKKKAWTTLNGYVAYLIYIDEHTPETLEYWYYKLQWDNKKKPITKDMIQDIWDHKLYRDITKRIVDVPDNARLIPNYPTFKPSRPRPSPIG